MGNLRGGKTGGGGIPRQHLFQKKITSLLHFALMSSHVVHVLGDWELPEFTMEAPFSAPYQQLTPDQLTEDHRIYLCRKMFQFKALKDANGIVFSETQFLMIRQN